jgi:hypothetical protein
VPPRFCFRCPSVGDNETTAPPHSWTTRGIIFLVNVHSSEGSRKTCERVVSRKLQFLRIASVCLILGVAALVLTLAIYLGG